MTVATALAAVEAEATWPDEAAALGSHGITGTFVSVHPSGPEGPPIPYRPPDFFGRVFGLNDLPGGRIPLLGGGTGVLLIKVGNSAEYLALGSISIELYCHCCPPLPPSPKTDAPKWLRVDKEDLG